MAVPSSGSVSISDLKAAFPSINSNSMSAYRGVKWYKSTNARGFFGNPTISLSESYDTRPTSPVTPGTIGTIYSSTGWTIPLFNKLYVTIKGGNGGQAGYDGTSPFAGWQGGNGTAGGASYFGGYLGASGGAGGAGGAGNGGATGATTSLTWDADADPSLLVHQNEGITLTVGGGGGGGGGGQKWRYADFPYPYDSLDGWYTDGNASGGSPGSGGYITISWT